MEASCRGQASTDRAHVACKVAQKNVFGSHVFCSWCSNPWVVWGSRSLFFRTGTASLGVLDVQIPMRPDADLRCAASARLLRGFCAVSFFGTVRLQKIVEVTFGVILCKPIVRARPRGTVLILSTKPHRKQCLKSLWGVILWNSIVGARPLRTVPVLSAKSYNKKWLKSLWVSFLEANCRGQATRDSAYFEHKATQKQRLKSVWGHSLEANCRGQASTDRAHVECKVAQKAMFEVTLGVIL